MEVYLERNYIKDFNPNYNLSGSHLYGQSPLKAGLRSLQTNNEATETGVKYLQNQTARGVLMSDEGDINEVQAQQLKDRFKQQYRGSNNAGDIVITPKKLSWINFGLNASLNEDGLLPLSASSRGCFLSLNGTEILIH